MCISSVSHRDLSSSSFSFLYKSCLVSDVAAAAVSTSWPRRRTHTMPYNEHASASETNGDLRPNIVAGDVIVSIAAGIAVALRLAARWTKDLSLGADDYTIILALVGCFSLDVL